MRRIAPFCAALLLVCAVGGAIPMHVDFKTLPAWMNAPFYRTIWDHNRFNVWRGGAGSGKSVGAVQRYVYRLTAERGHNLMVLRKVAESNRYSTFALFLSVIESWSLSPVYDVNETTMVIKNHVNGNCVIFRGMNDMRARERVKSVTFPSGPLTDIWVEEASEFDQEDVKQLNLRMRGQAPRPFQMTLSFNPVSVGHWLKAEFFDNPKPNATLMKTTYLDNRFIDSGYREELEGMKQTDPILYQIYALGEWGELGEHAFPHVVFERSKYHYDDFDRVVFGMDFGYQHYHAIEGIGMKDGELWSFCELYVRQKTDPQIIPLAERVLPKWQRCLADHAEPKSIALWKNAGYRVEPVKKGPDSVEAGFAYLRGKRWHIDPVTCPGLAAEVRGAVYKKDRNGRVTEEIFSFHDDALAASRYAIEEFMKPKAKVSIF